MNYKTYAEAKIANPDSEIVTTCNGWDGGKNFIGTFEVLCRGFHVMGENSWVICNPADYCSSLKEFLEADLALVEGDTFTNVNGSVETVTQWTEDFVNAKGGGKDRARFILSAAALNGGCKIPVKVEQWTIYNNTMPLCELTDEQYGKMRRMHDAGAVVEFANVTNEFKFEVIEKPNWCKDQVYRIKPKSERELFIDKSIKLVKSENYESMNKMFGVQFDAGARYKDLTQHFGENI